MKTFLLAVLLLVLSGGRVRAQAASAAAASGGRRTEEYCEVQVRGRLFSSKVVVSVDFGQAQEGLLVDTYKDAAGNVLKFASPIDALNFLNAQGWELMQVYVTGKEGNSAHYLMRRRMVN